MMEARNILLAEIDKTIDQLIQNEETLKKISCDPFYEIEAAALEKTQESLLAHLMHLQDFLKEKGEEPPQIDRSVKKLITPSRSRVRRHHNAKSFK